MNRSNLLLLLPVLLAVSLYVAWSSSTSTSSTNIHMTKPSTAMERNLYNAVIEWHKDVGASASESPDVFLATHFTQSGELVARSCGLYRTGYVSLTSESRTSETEGVFDVEPSPKGKLTPAQMMQISELIKELPSNQEPQQWRDLIVFTFLDSKRKRHTRLYSRADLPSQVREIYGIIGAPLEVTGT